MTLLLLATKNPAKLREYRAMLSETPFDLTDLATEGVIDDVEETGDTFEQNAALKAQHWAQITGILTLADDSGLEVDALRGEPGVLSARYAGPDATDRQRNELLLQKLAGKPREERTARFRCVIAIAEPAGRTKFFKGTCEGEIAEAAKGSNGFGYDPVFFLPKLGKTMAELPPEVKNSLSHRAEALAKAKDALLNWSSSGEPDP